MYVGVAAAAAAVGLGVGLRRYATSALSPDALQVLWASEFETPAGERLAMSQFQGKPLVLNFWATWCPPCVEEMPLIESFYQQNASKGWQVVGLAVDQPSRVRHFLSQASITYPIGLAGMNGSELGQTLGNSQASLPFTLVLDAQGGVIQQKLGKLTAEEVKNWAS
jgi:thiol-disulfide isomerase/thioredoxin